jgi:PAS domain S-box-containing protein
MHGVGHAVVNDSDELVEFVGTTMDITERKRAEEEVRKQAALLGLAHDAIVVRDLENRVVFWNRGAENTYGWTAEEAIGTVTHELLRTKFPIPLKAVDAAIAEQGKWEGELTHTTRQGTPIIVASRWSLQRDEYGAPSAVLEINRDITERKRAEEAMRQAQADLAHVARVTTLGELSASIAHEVNQPLAAIVTHGEAGLLWLDREVPDLAEVREALDAMISSGRRASEIIHRLRALAKRTETQKVAVDINEAITEVIALVQHEVLSHQVSLRLELAPTLPAVLADRTQFQQVIVNLVVNAMQAVAQEGNRDRKVSIRTSMPDPATISCTVEDNGSGIKLKHLPRLFDSFFTTKDSGMGMGLSICRSIIESHGGHVTADNETALGGARLCVTLPCSSQYPL